MTADIELLPLPRTLQHADDADLAAHVQDYARACAEHATAPLRAHRDRLTLHVLDLEADRSGLIGACDEYRQRAERLAEALRNSSDALERLAFAIRAPNAHTPQLVELAIAMRATALAALRDHDKEVDNGFWPEMTKSGGPDWTGFDG